MNFIAIGNMRMANTHGKMKNSNGNSSLTGACMASFSAWAKSFGAPLLCLGAQDGAQAHASGLRLNKGRYEVRHCRHVEPGGQFAQGFAACAAGAHVAHQAGEFVAKRAGGAFGDGLGDGTVEVEPGFDAQGDEAEHEGQGLEGLPATCLDAVA